MTFYKRAFLYLKRKSKKCSLLMLILFTINVFVLGASAIQRISEENEHTIGSQMDVKIVQRQASEKQMVPLSVYEVCKNQKNISFINRFQHEIGKLQNLKNVEIDSTLGVDNDVTLYAYDNMEKESYFATSRHKMVKGRTIKASDKNKIVVHQTFASLNNLKINDNIQFKTKNGQVSLKIIGIFIDTDARKDVTAPLLRQHENQMYIDHSAFQEIFPGQGYENISYYVKDPSKSEQIVKKLQQLTHTTSLQYEVADEQYQEMKQYLNQNRQMSTTIIFISVISGSVIMALILFMWIKNRQKEVGILLSIGNTKTDILLQLCLEVCILSCIALVIAVCIVSFCISPIMTIESNVQSAILTDSIGIASKDIFYTLCLNFAIIVIALGFATYPILRMEPKNILSQHT